MRAAWLTGAAFGLVACLAGCGGKTDTAAAPIGPAPGSAASLTVDQSWINAAQKASDAIGGCDRPAGGARESRVVTLEKNKIVLLPCSQADMVYTDRLFSVGPKDIRLLSLPDYDATGWFASDQASLAELDAGTGVLTTQRKIGGKENCGSEGRYQWTGARFDLQELRWQACGDKNLKRPPFPVIWPAPAIPGADLSNSAPAP